MSGGVRNGKGKLRVEEVENVGGKRRRNGEGRWEGKAER